MRSAIENWYAKVCKISEYSIRYTLKVGLAYVDAGYRHIMSA